MKYRIIQEGGSYYPQYTTDARFGPWVGFQSAFTGRVGFPSINLAETFLKTIGVT